MPPETAFHNDLLEEDDSWQENLSRRQKAFRAAEYLGVAAGTLIAEILLVKGLLGGIWPLGLVVTGHVAMTVALVLWSVQRGGRGGAMRLSSLLAMTAATLGPLGAAGALLAGGMLALYQLKSHSFDDWYRSIFPDFQLDPARKLYEDLQSGREEGGTLDSVASFADILAFGTVRQKQSVIALIARHFRPEFSPALHRALTDIDASVRVQAATAIAKIEDDFSRRWVALEERLKRSPRNFAAAHALAVHLDDYGYTGLLDTSREKEIRHQALGAYRLSHGLNPADNSIQLAIGRLLVREGDYEMAAIALEPLVAAGEADAAAAGWYCECLYGLGRFDELQSLADDWCARHGDDEIANDNLVSALRMWRGRKATDMSAGGLHGVPA